MSTYLDEKERYYIEYFGEPALIAHDVIPKPHVDVYIFPTAEQNFIYLTKGMEELGYREYLIITLTQEQWPAYFLQALCGYQIREKAPIKELELFENVADIKDTNGFNQALILDVAEIGLDNQELALGLHLKASPLYVYPVTKEELKYSYEAGITALHDALHANKTPFADIHRPSVV